MHFCADEARAIVLVATAALPVLPRVRRRLKTFFAELACLFVHPFFVHGGDGPHPTCPCWTCAHRRGVVRDNEADKMREWLRDVAPTFVRRLR